MKEDSTMIFIVDDSNLSLELISKEMENALHCRIKKFNSAEECLMNLNETPDIILSDYYLDSEYGNRMNGDQMLIRIKKDHSNIPVIMYSSKCGLDVVLKLLKLGATDFIPKEKNFIKIIRTAAIKHLNRIKSDYHDSIAKRRVIVTCVLVTTAIFLLRSYLPDALPYFMLILYVLGCAWLFSDARISKNRKEFHNS